MNNKSIFAKNLQRQMDVHNKTRKDVCDALGFSYYTFSDWVNGKKYPRMDKVEQLANYFGVLKSDLIEEHAPEREDMRKKNDRLATIVLRMRNDETFMAAVDALYDMEPEKLSSLLGLLK